MEKPTHEQVQGLIGEVVIPFYMVERDMLLPNMPEGRRRNENDAEHSWSVAMLACTLAPHIDEKLDVGLVAQFAIVHDLVEVFANDTSVWADSTALDSKENNEAKALEQLKQNFGHFPWLTETVEAYEAQESDEARYVRAIDKYIALCIRFMDGGEFYREKGITKHKFDKNLATHRVKAHGHKGVAEYYEAIRTLYEQHPEHFAPPSTRGQDTTA
ncbi:HD domain-containing protein [Candidatus Saccharibacteria bacterium]|nr:HD domain-containing protein [Candidatus Saccharibacteria bacterium]